VTDLWLRENGPPVACELDDATAFGLAGAGVVAVTPLGRGRWELRSARKVGVFRVGQLTVWIQPKIAIQHLLWLLGWARRPGWVGPDLIGFAAGQELVPALAHAFSAQVERALLPGLLQGYVEVDSTEPVLRGRLRTADQLRQRHGVAIPLLVRYDDYRSDIPENQLLRAATSKLLGLPGVSASVRGRLRALRGLVIDVSDLPTGRPLPAWIPSRLNARYHDALWLAEVILNGGAIEQVPGNIRVEGFLIDLYQVFEDFVTATLATHLERLGGHCRAQDRGTLDEEGCVDIRPDLVWRSDGRPVAVIDAKYKAEAPAGFPQADLYQALAYATAYGLDGAHLVYAKGNEIAQDWTVRNVRVRITAHTLDLDAPPAEVLGQVERLAARIAHSVEECDDLGSSSSLRGRSVVAP
jgi:5-methylcytosine-specific restriction enzyme subunit McrC